MMKFIRSSVTTLLLITAAINGTVKSEEAANPFTTLVETPDPPSPHPPPSTTVDSSLAFPVLTRVVNVFPPSRQDGSRVSVVLDEDRVEGLGYGGFVERETMMHGVEDFVIDFKHPTTGGKTLPETSR